MSADTNVQKIGYEVTFDKNRWAGPVFMTRDMIFVPLMQRINKSDLMMAGVAGGLGGAIGGAIAGLVLAKAKPNQASVGKLADIPMAIREKIKAHQDKKNEVPTLIIPRSATRSIIKKSMLNNTMTIATTNGEVVITHSMFTPGKVKQGLADNNWPVRWRGHDCGAPIKA